MSYSDLSGLIATLTAQRDAAKAESGRFMADNMGLGRALVAAEKDRDDWRTKALAEHGTHSPPLAARLRAAEKVCEAAERELHPWWDGADDLRDALTEWRRTKEGAAHTHRYPKPNGQGFPINQCLDCREWK